MYNPTSLDGVCAGYAYAMGIEAPEHAQPAAEQLTALVDEMLQGRKADRVFMYNPDAIAQWVSEKYANYLTPVAANTQLELPLCSVMPSVTPVCFGTIYTGAQPAVHGIRQYAKPVIKIDTLWDALIRAGKKAAIVADTECSMGKIYLERDMDYFLYDTIEEINAKAAELIMKDEYDFIAVYNGNYDSTMHKNGTEAPISLAQLVANAQAYGTFAELIKNHWKQHDTLIGFAMDHGCHDIDGSCGSHGLDMEEDLNIKHFYGIIPKQI